jgi:hypothetical protein
VGLTRTTPLAKQPQICKRQHPTVPTDYTGRSPA